MLCWLRPEKENQPARPGPLQRWYVAAPPRGHFLTVPRLFVMLLDNQTILQREPFMTTAASCSCFCFSQEKDKEKKEKEKDSKEKEKKVSNGHQFTAVASVQGSQCSQCNKALTGREAFHCTRK